MLTHSYTYEAALADSHKITWRVEDIIGGDKQLDFSKPFLPESLAGTASIRCLSAREQLLLNQIRGNSYLYLFGFVEEFILPFVLDQARAAVHGADAVEVRALVTFAEEEAKHIHLFRRFSAEFARGFGAECGAIGPAKDVAAAILKHGALGVAMVTLHLEWMTQRHYLDSVKEGDAEGLDPQFSSLLRHHWMEEAQHAKLDTLLVAKLAREAGPEGIARAFDDYVSIGTMLDGGLAAQARLDIEALERAAGRPLAEAEKAEIFEAQQRSYRWTFLGSGMTHPNFVRALGELSPAGAERIAAMAKALA
ncbi:hypothetical protein [Sorangium sp. So ce128]|uniref:hypothetical protein n=1 Tax=Sorangium sp. So ce128 TaxID=3133281 RepID=UPI003F5ECF94